MPMIEARECDWRWLTQRRQATEPRSWRSSAPFLELAEAPQKLKPTSRRCETTGRELSRHMPHHISRRAEHDISTRGRGRNCWKQRTLCHFALGQSRLLCRTFPFQQRFPRKRLCPRVFKAGHPPRHRSDYYGRRPVAPPPSGEAARRAASCLRPSAWRFSAADQ
jgi:hypothetical protein